MGKKFTIGCVVAIIVIVGLSLGAYIISSRNNMVAKEVTIDQAWAQVQNVYQRRLDLIPNLVESTKGYMQLEKDIFEAIAEARSGINNAETPMPTKNKEKTANINSHPKKNNRSRLIPVKISPNIKTLLTPNF